MQAASMCGLERSAASVSVAAAASSNAIAAVLLSAMIPASAARSRCRDARKRTESAERIPSPVNTRAAAVVARMIAISFRRIGISRNAVVALLLFDIPRNAQQFGTDLQPGGGSGGLVDIKPHAAVVHDKGDHAPIPQEALSFSDGQNAGT